MFSTADVSQLIQYIDDDTLVVGPALQGHEFEEGTQPLRGRTCPWNTAAIWTVSKLQLVGFPLIGDGMRINAENVEGGVEVFTFIDLHKNNILLSFLFFYGM